MTTTERRKRGIGLQCKVRRLESGLTLAEAAAAMGMDHTYLSRIENGHINATLATLERLARVYECTFALVPMTMHDTDRARYMAHLDPHTDTLCQEEQP